MWFDIYEIDDLPRRAEGEIQAEQWKTELRRVQARRAAQRQFDQRMQDRRIHAIYGGFGGGWF